MSETVAPNGQRISFMATVTCQHLSPAIKPLDIDVLAARQVAPLAVLMQRENVFAVVAATQHEGFRIVHAYVSPGESDPMFADLKKDPHVWHYTAATQLAGDHYARLRAQAEILQEDRAYAECRALVLDVAAATQSPDRAKACGQLMETVDRARGMRQAQAAQAERMDLERERLAVELRGARAAEEAASAQRMQAVFSAAAASGRAFQRPPIQIQPIGGDRRTTYTNCTTYGRNTDCTTR